MSKLRKWPRWIAVALSVGLSSGYWPLAWAETDWYLLKSHGQAIGHIRIETQQTPDGHMITEVENRNRFTRMEEPFEVVSTSRFEEDKQHPVRFDYHYQLSDQPVIQASGDIGQDKLAIRFAAQKQPTEAAIETEQFMFPEGPALREAYKRHFNAPSGASFEFQTLHLALGPQVVNTRVTAEGAPSKGGTRRFAVRNQEDEKLAISEWRDADGRLMRAESLRDNMEMVYASSMEVRSLGGQGLDALRAAEIPTNIIPLPRQTHEAIYQIRPLTGESLNLGGIFPENLQQSLLPPDPKRETEGMNPGILLQVKQADPDNVLAEYPIRHEQRYLQATPYLQSDDYLIEKNAREIVGGEKRAYYAARKLQQWINQNISYKDYAQGFASAKETLEQHQGDCTEHAVLLAAMARSLGIPSRLVVGYQYLSNHSQTLGKFVAHMWAEVYIGQMGAGEWVPFDATNPETVPDATHIKIADSALTDLSDLASLTQQVIGLMGRIQIDVVKAISPGQSVVVFGNEDSSRITIPVIDIEERHLSPSDIPEIDVKTLSRDTIGHFRVNLPPRTMTLDSAEGQFTHGMDQLAQGRIEAALSAFQTALNKTQIEHPLATYRMGERLASIGVYNLARQAFQRAKQQEPGLHELSRSWLEQRLPPSISPTVQRQYLEALSHWPYRNDAASAELVLHDLVRVQPNFYPAYINLGQIADSQGQTDSAAEWFNRAIQAKPDAYTAHEALGDMYASNEQYGKAVSPYNQALQLAKTNSNASGIKGLSAKYQLVKAAARLNTGKNAQAWLEMGKALMAQHKAQEAKGAFQNALILQPSSSEAQLHAFDAYLQTSEWQKLAELYPRISAMGTAHALKLKGYYEMRTRRYDKAVDSLKRAIAQAPAQADAYLFLADTYRRKAELASGSNTSSQVISTLRDGFRKVSGPDRYRLLDAYAHALNETAQGAEAVPVAREMIQINPLDASGYVRLGKAELLQGDYRQASKDLKAALILDPNHVEALVSLALSAQEEGRDIVALDHLQRAVRIAPRNVEAVAALKNLIASKGLNTRPPKDVWLLTPDERDYLVQMFSLEATRINAEIQFWQNINPLMDKVNGPFSKAWILAKQEIVPVTEAIIGKENGFYQYLQQEVPPLRLKQFHQDMLIFYYRQMAQFYWVLKTQPALRSPSEIELLMAENKAIYSAILASNQKVADNVKALQQKVSLPIFEELLTESGNSDTQSSLQKLNTLVLEFQAKLGGNKQEAAKTQNARKPPATH